MPLSQFCCSLKHPNDRKYCARKSILGHGHHLDRMSWLRHHRMKYHKKEFDMSIKKGVATRKANRNKLVMVKVPWYKKPLLGVLNPTTSNPMYYVASAWWHDNDPFVTVVSSSGKKVEKSIYKAMKDQAIDAYNFSDPEDKRKVNDYLSDIGWSGVDSVDASYLKKHILNEQEFAELQREDIVYV